MSKQRVKLTKNIVKSYFISGCQRQLVHSLSGQDQSNPNEYSELAQAGSDLELTFFNHLSSMGLLTRSPKRVEHGEVD